MALSLQMCFQTGPPEILPPASDPQAVCPTQRLSQHPCDSGVQRTQGSASMTCVCAPACMGARGQARLGPWEQPRSRDPAQNLTLLSPCNTTYASSQLWGFSLLYGFFCCCCLVIFWLFPAIWGMGWARHLSFPKAYWAPTPFLQHMCTTCKVSPPSRKKESPQPVKTGGGGERGNESIPSPKRESKLKKI